MKVPFLDLKANYKSIKSEVDVAIQEVLDNTAFALGFAVNSFEENFAKYIGVKHAIACNSGTSALHLALLVAGIGEGDEVITTPHTFVSTIWAISYVGATPVFVDIDKNEYTIDPAKIEAKITKKTKALLPIHLYGQTANITPLKDIAKKYNLLLIEDAAQAHGAEFEGKKCGSFGDMACFSFYPGKNLGAFGEGGMVVTNNDEYAEKIKLYRNHCQPEKYIHTDIGYNYRMDGIQGAVLDVKLKHIEKWNILRRSLAKRYSDALSKIAGITPPYVPEYSNPVWHLYELKLETKQKRDELLEFLHKNDVGAGLHYPIPVHLQKAYADLNHKKGDFPITENISDTCISLPIFPDMSEEQCDYVIEKVQEFMK